MLVRSQAAKVCHAGGGGGRFEAVFYVRRSLARSWRSPVGSDTQGSRSLGAPLSHIHVGCRGGRDIQSRRLSRCGWQPRGVESGRDVRSCGRDREAFVDEQNL